MFIAANIPVKLRYSLFREAFQHATDLDNLVIIELNNKEMTRYEHYGEAIPKWANHMRTWGEAGVVTLKSNATPKVGNRGKTCIFVGYSKMHSGNCYRIYDSDTKRVHTTRDVKWLMRWFYDNDNKPI